MRWSHPHCTVGQKVANEVGSFGRHCPLCFHDGFAPYYRCRDWYVANVSCHSPSHRLCAWVGGQFKDLKANKVRYGDWPANLVSA